MEASETRTSFYWPVTIPLYIMHVDLWAPGTSVSNNSAGRHLLNVMCNLTHFSLSNITMEKHAEHLAKLLMENVGILFSMVYIIFINTKYWFKSVLKDMFTALGIIYCPLTHGNHKYMNVEKHQ